MREKQKQELDRLVNSLVDGLHVNDPGFWEPVLKDIALLDLHVLVAIAEAGAPNVKDVRSRFDLPNSTVTGILDRLEKAGLIQRTLDSRDRRSFGLAVTDKGREVVAAHARGHAAVVDRIALYLDRSELAAFTAILEKIEAALGGEKTK